MPHPTPEMTVLITLLVVLLGPGAAALAAPMAVRPVTAAVALAPAPAAGPAPSRLGVPTVFREARSFPAQVVRDAEATTLRGQLAILRFALEAAAVQRFGRYPAAKDYDDLDAQLQAANELPLGFDLRQHGIVLTSFEVNPQGYRITGRLDGEESTISGPEPRASSFWSLIR